ncbi:MAG: GGDEF domain-containing protein [Synechococcales bacterium]|nr:GGDEF domain-containing protein [Synechococcales bacterium]
MADLFCMESPLQVSPESLAGALDLVDDAVLLIDAIGRVRWCNRAFRELIGATTDVSLQGADPVDLLPLTVQGETIAPANHPATQALTHLTGNLIGELHLPSLKQVAIAWSSLSLVDPNDVVAVIFIRTLPSGEGLPVVENPLPGPPPPPDTLTGLAERSVLMDVLETTLKSARLPESQPDPLPLVVIGISLDQFRIIHNSLGQLDGERLLAQIAARLSSELRPDVLLVRLEMDQLALLGRGDRHWAIQIAELIQSQLRLPFRLGDRHITVTASIGIVVNVSTYDCPLSVIRDVNVAIHWAASAGRGNYKVFEPSLLRRLVEQLELESDLWRALENQDFELYYQPIVLLKNEQIVGFEALLRWHHPQRGHVLPLTFIPLAEAIGLIDPLGDWTLREACCQMQKWRTQFPNLPLSFVSVNISGKQFSQPDLVQQIQQILSETALPARSLILEITESMIMEDMESAILMLKELHRLGVGLAVDDFGTGYSSLGYLHRFPVEILKLDRSFVSSIDVDAEKVEIIQTLVSLAWNLGMDIVAEGVETAKQLAQLRALRCERGQGYFFARPQSARDITRLLQQMSPTQKVG